LAIHQGANDGFRGIYIYCYDGPNTNYGLTVFSNADLKGVLFNSEVTQILLEELKVQGINFQKFKKNFDVKNISQEEIVNIGYKNLIFQAFESSDSTTLKLFYSHFGFILFCLFFTKLFN